MSSMLAVLARERGGAEQLRDEHVPVPRPRAGEVLVEVHAAAITPTEFDWEPSWTTKDGSSRLPVVPAHDVSGVVTGVGEGVTTRTVGEPVYGLIDFWRNGAAAEYATVPVEDLAPKPASIDDIHAAAVPMSGLTALQGLFVHSGLAMNQRLLVHGGAGGVGTYAVQLGRNAGAEVIATASARDADLVERLGAAIVIDYHAQRFEEVINDVDVVFDTVGGDTQTRSWSVLKPGGTLVSTVDEPSAALAEEHQAQGLTFIVEPNPIQLTALANLIDTGQLVPLVSAVYSLERTRDAYRAAQRDHRPGKVVLSVTPDAGT
jgi:NADPH:quinone reductase-like Zn-dependent oxidoreductase